MTVARGKPPPTPAALVARAESACRDYLGRRRDPGAANAAEEALKALARADWAESHRVRTWFVARWWETPGSIPEGEG